MNISTTPTGSYRALDMTNPKLTDAINAVIHRGKDTRAPPAYAIPDLEESFHKIQSRIAQGGAFIPTAYVSPRTNLAQSVPENRFGRSIVTHPTDPALLGHRLIGSFEGESDEIEVTLWTSLPNVLALFAQVKSAKLVIIPASSWVQRGKTTAHGYKGLFIHRLAVPARSVADASAENPLAALSSEQQNQIISAAQAQAQSDAEKGILTSPAVRSTLADLRTKLIAAIDATLTPTTTPETPSDPDVFDLDAFDDEDGE